MRAVVVTFVVMAIVAFMLVLVRVVVVVVMLEGHAGHPRPLARTRPNQTTE
jgi:hypothetical protein